MRNGLVVFDLDGTLLREQTVCELLAASLGHNQEMQQFEQLSLESDIIDARATMASWYVNSSQAELYSYLERATLAPNALAAIQRLQAHNIEVAIASITWKFAVAWFATRLNIHHHLATELLPSGEILHVWGRDKATWMQQLAMQYNIPSMRIAAIGDSSGDYDMLSAAHLGFFVGKDAPSNAKSVIHLPNADIQTIVDHILTAWQLSVSAPAT